MALVVPINYQREVRGMTCLHSGHVCNWMPCISNVAYYRHRMKVFMSECWKSAGYHNLRLLDMDRLLHYYLGHWCYLDNRLLHYYLRHGLLHYYLRCGCYLDYRTVVKGSFHCQYELFHVKSVLSICHFE
jgi:hypothetical protein